MFAAGDREPRPACTGSAHPRRDKYTRPLNAEVSDRGTGRGRQQRLNPLQPKRNRELGPVHSTGWFGGDPRRDRDQYRSGILRPYPLGRIARLPAHDPWWTEVNYWERARIDRTTGSHPDDVHGPKPSIANCMYRLCPPPTRQIHPSAERHDHRPCALRFTLGTTVPRTVRVHQMVGQINHMLSILRPSKNLTAEKSAACSPAEYKNS